MIVDQLELIASLRERAAELRFLAGKLEDVAAGSAIRLRQVADICERDATALQQEWDEAVEYEKREAAEIEANKARRERNRQLEDEERQWALENGWGE